MEKTKIIMREDCNAPSRWLFLDYSGKNPFGVASKIAEMLTPFFAVSSAGISETEFKWDNSGDPIDFYFTWWVERSDPFGRFSKQRYDIKVQGKQTKEDKTGSFTLQIFGTLITEFDSGNPFARGLWWFYDYIFYSSRRAEYLKDCEEHMRNFVNEIKKHFNIQVLEHVG